MKIKSHLALNTVALAIAALILYLSTSVGVTLQPVQSSLGSSPTPSVSPIMQSTMPAAPQMGERMPGESKTEDDTLSATGMEHVPVFD
ncbi:MAG TPA: hypothetical protein VD978_15330 [Azospirillum sp.]|nr:hypothetical protein [Azospirillum sp.]